MIEIIDFFSQRKKLRNSAQYENGSQFMGKLQLSMISRERMIEIIDFFAQRKKPVTVFNM